MAVAHMRREPRDTAFIRLLDDALGRIGESVICRPMTKEHSYGDLVARVDLARSPAEFYFGFSNPDGLDQLAVDSIPWKVIDRLSRSRLRAFRAMHENQDHFAPRALIAFHEWHTLALHQAAEGGLAGALLVNAFADHYLQDHFAPGHVFTPRQGLSDVLSVGIHDYYNRRGSRYWPRRTTELATLLPSDLQLWDLAMQRLVPRACGGAEVAACLERMERQGIVLRGDKQLARMPEQELYLILVAARSALDVLESARRGRAEDTFGVPSWEGYRIRLVPESPGEAAHYRIVPPTANIGYGAHDTTASRVELGPLAGLRVSPPFDRPLIASYAIESLPSSGGDERSVLSLETILFAWAGDFIDDDPGPMRSSGTYQALALVQPAALIGADLAFGEEGQVGFGPTLRYLVPVPAINAQLSLDGGARLYPNARTDDRVAPHLGGTLVFGFGLLHLGTRVGIGRYMGEGRVLHSPTVTLSPIITAILPIRRYAWPRDAP